MHAVRSGEEAQHPQRGNRAIANLGEKGLHSADTAEEPRKLLHGDSAVLLAVLKYLARQILHRRAYPLELVGQPVDGRIEQPNESRRTVAAEFGVAARVV